MKGIKSHYALHFIFYFSLVCYSLLNNILDAHLLINSTPIFAIFRPLTLSWTVNQIKLKNPWTQKMSIQSKKVVPKAFQLSYVTDNSQQWAKKKKSTKQKKKRNKNRNRRADKIPKRRVEEGNNFITIREDLAQLGNVFCCCCWLGSEECKNCNLIKIYVNAQSSQLVAGWLIETLDTLP